MAIHVKLVCRRCRTAFLLKPGLAHLNDLCETCSRREPNEFAAAANRQYGWFVRNIRRSAETGKALNPFETGSTSLRKGSR